MVLVDIVPCPGEEIVLPASLNSFNTPENIVVSSQGQPDMVWRIQNSTVVRNAFSGPLSTKGSPTLTATCPSNAKITSIHKPTCYNFFNLPYDNVLSANLLPMQQSWCQQEVRMPNKKSPSSLQQLCLSCVDANLNAMQHQLANQPSAIIHSVYEQQCEKYKLPSEYHKKERVLDPNIFIRSHTKSLRLLHNFFIEIANQTAPTFTASSTFKLAHRGDCVTDQVAMTIGENCQELTHLDLSRCAVSDVGLRSLNSCKQLEVFKVDATNVTAEGCLEIILDQLPVLKIFENSNWPRIIKLLKQQFLKNSNKPRRTYSLEQLPEGAIMKNDQDITFMAASFPNLRNFIINPRFLISPPVDFKELTLYSSTVSNEIGSFKNLRRLTLCLQGPFRVTELQLKMLLLQCQNLEDFELRNCRTLTDCLISELVELNALENLKRLYLRDCCRVNLNMIMKLLKMKNQLNMLYVQPIMDISTRDEINAYIKCNNLDLELKGYD
uniref:Uncharacterized protein n=1 Tax=Strigamia maritima TaxID=126957 RepID=T1IX89_STRMM